MAFIHASTARPEAVQNSRKTAAVRRALLVKDVGVPARHVHSARYELRVPNTLAHCSKKPTPEQARKGAVLLQRQAVFGWRVAQVAKRRQAMAMLISLIHRETKLGYFLTVD